MLVNNDINKNSSIALTSVELQVFDVCLRVSFPKVRLISYAEILDIKGTIVRLFEEYLFSF